jgi:predicted nucleic acid-binding protein
MVEVPASRVVIADAGPLIALAGVSCPHLLQVLSREVWITRTVRDEILPDEAAFDDAPELLEALGGDWFHVVDADAPSSTFAAIDAGEASAIHLAQTWREQGGDRSRLAQYGRKTVSARRIVSGLPE